MRMEPNNKKKLFSLDEATNAITELLAHGTIDTQIAHRFLQELESGKNTFILVPEFIVGPSSAAVKNILAELTMLERPNVTYSVSVDEDGDTTIEATAFSGNLIIIFDGLRNLPSACPELIIKVDNRHRHFDFNAHSMWTYNSTLRDILDEAIDAFEALPTVASRLTAH